MNTSQYILNLGLLAVILGGNLGTRTMTVRRLLVPVVLVAVAGYVYLRAVPTAGNDTYLEIAGATLGVLLGVAAAALVRVRRDGQRVLATAGAAFAALWIAVVGGRIRGNHHCAAGEFTVVESKKQARTPIDLRFAIDGERKRAAARSGQADED